MELSYTINWDRQLKSQLLPPHGVCAVSVYNLIAFSSYGLCHTLPKNLELNSINIVDFGHLDEVYSFPSKQSTIISLKWNDTGSLLLSADRFGNFKIFKQSSSVINDWVLVKSVDPIPGIEPIVAEWLPSKPMVCLRCDTTESVDFTVRYPSCQDVLSQRRTFGGLTEPEFVAVLRNGCFLQCGLSASEEQPRLVKLCWEAIDIACFTVDHQGNIFTCISTGNLSDPVRLFKVTEDRELLSYFYVDNDQGPATVVALEFANHSDYSKVVACVCSDGGTRIELWSCDDDVIKPNPTWPKELTEEELSSCEGTSCQKWTVVASCNDTAVPSAIAVPPLPIHSTDHLGTDSSFLVGFFDGSVKLFNKFTLQPMPMVRIDSVAAAPTKRIRASNYVTSIAYTSLCCGVILVDDELSLHQLRLSDGVTPTSAVRLLHYSAITGHDPADVLQVCAPFLDTVVPKFVDEYQKQSNDLQELLNVKYQAVCMMLLHSSGERTKCMEQHYKLLLESICTFFKTLVRPSTSIDKSPIERLQTALQAKPLADLDSIMVSSVSTENHSDFVIEGTMIQPLQPLIQWIAECSLYVISTVTCGRPGGIAHDPCVLASLRELFFLIRVWSFVKTSSLPVFTKTVDIDVFSAIFKLITQLWSAARENVEPEEQVIADCYLLSTQVLSPPPNDYPRLPVPPASPATFRAMGPSLQPGAWHYVDVVRRIHLGVNPASRLKQCVKCGSVSMFLLTGNRGWCRLWEKRWENRCLCSGQWKLLLMTPLAVS